uniref:Uncharacterized protein n=1 Tax=Anguilla anguilla TaxID=7936 RepID=A0A0E9QR00_ANGAN
MDDEKWKMFLSFGI